MSQQQPGHRARTTSMSSVGTHGTHDVGLDSSSSSSTHSDDAVKLFASAPWWLYCTSWKLAKPENVGTESCTFRVTGPVSSDEMMQLYRSKRLKGSVLMAGLTQAAKDTRAGQDLPASVYRTLAHLFEMSRNGVPYTPVDCDGVKGGMSAASWARPLWTICEPSLPGGGPADKRYEEEEDEAAQEQKSYKEITKGKDAEQEEDDDEEGRDGTSDSRRCSVEEDVALAVRLLRSAPSWCYLYSHEPLKSKKTPPKTSAHMVDMYKSGCLPEWTPLLGLRHEVAHFNSLPPSLFTTLGALLTVLQAGLELQPVGLVELQRYDKFIECRNHVGSTMRVPSSDSLHGATSGSLLFNRRVPGAGSMPVDGLTKALSGLTPVGQKAANGTGGHHANGSNGNSSAAHLGSPTHGTWATSNGTSGETDSPGTPLQPSFPGLEPPVMGPYGMPMQPHMQVYQAMLPTWLWGMPHMPYTVMASPAAAAAAASQQMHGLGSPLASVGGSPARRSNGSGKQRSGAGGRTAMGSTPGSPAMLPPMAVPAIATASSPGAAHRLAQSSVVSNGSATSSGGAQRLAMGSPTNAMMVAAGMPGSPHLLMPAGMMPADPATAAAAMQAGLWGWPAGMPAAAAPQAGTSPWSTSVFRLFMADSSRGLDVPVWWHLDPRVPGGLVGPLGAEAMIMAYARGGLTEMHMVCGTHSDVTAASPPAREFFEELGGLLRQVEAGGQYVLVTLSEVTQHASLASSSGGAGSSVGGASSGRQPKSARKSNKAGSSSSNGLQTAGSAPVPPRTPTSTHSTSPRHEDALAAQERWDSNGLSIRSSPSAVRTKASPRQQQQQPGMTQRSPTSPGPATLSPRSGDRGRMAMQAGDLPASPHHDVSSYLPSSTGGSATTPRMTNGTTGGGGTEADTATPPTSSHDEEEGCDEPQDSVFATQEAVAAAIAAASAAAASAHAVAAVMVAELARGGSAGGTGLGNTTPRGSLSLANQQGSGLLLASESGRLLCCLGARDQARKSSRGGAPPALSVKDSLDQEESKMLANLCSGELRDSDDDVRGPAARDAHDSRTCSCGGVPGTVAAGSTEPGVPVAAAAVPTLLQAIQAAPV